MKIFKTDPETGSVYIEEGAPDIATVLKKLRTDLNFSQSEIARRMGITQPRIIAIEKSKDGLMVGTVKRYLKALGYDMTLQAASSVISTVDNSDALIGRISGKVYCPRIKPKDVVKVDIDYKAKFKTAYNFEYESNGTVYVVDRTPGTARIVVYNDSPVEHDITVGWTASIAE